MQILRFYTYFIESIQDQGTEIERRRRCTILYFLEDDSVQVMEPVEHNSGIPQGEDDSDEGYRNILHGDRSIELVHGWIGWVKLFWGIPLTIHHLLPNTIPLFKEPSCDGTGFPSPTTPRGRSPLAAPTPRDTSPSTTSTSEVISTSMAA